MAATAQAYGAFDLSRMPPGWTPNPERVQSSLTDYESSTAQTMALMGRHVSDALNDPAIIDLGKRCSGSWGRGPTETRCSWDSFWFCKHWIRFIVDENSVWRFFHETDQVDFLIAPSVLIRMKRPAGDCDDFSMMMAALLMANGIPCEFVTVACDRNDRRRWSHVYVRAILSDGRHVPLDPAVGDYPGWEVLERDIYRMQAWDMNGQPVETARSSRPDAGMHYYANRGLGDGDVMIEPTVDPSTLPTSLNATAPDYYATTTPGVPIGSGSGTGINWTAILGNLTSGGFKLGQMALLPSGSSLLPSGAVISPYGAAGGLLTAGGVPNLSSLIVWGGAAVVLIMIINAVSKK